MTHAPFPVTAQSLSDMPDRADLIGRSGLDFMQDILAGKLAAPPICDTLGFTLSAVAPGRVTFEGTAGFGALNVMSGVHGGWYGAILDSAMGCAVMTLLDKGHIYTTLEYKINITRALPSGTPAIATGLTQHGGRRTAVATGELRGKTCGKLFATASTTCLIMDAPG